MRKPLLPLLVAMSAGAAAQAQSPFSTTMRSYPLGHEAATNTSVPTAHAVADLDGDGDLDIVHSYAQGSFGSGSQVFSILRNGGAGGGADGFGAPEFTNTPGPTAAVVARDLDGDGDIDLAFSVSVDVSGSTVLVYLNDGSGGFGNPMTVAVGQTPRDLFAADIDSDGDVDLLTANWFVSNSISVLRNNGSAQFTRTDIAMPARPTFVRAGDLNGDGLAEIVVSVESASPVQVLVNNGAAGFGAPQAYQPPIQYIQQQGRGIALGDADGDGDVDVFYAVGKVIGYASPVIVLRNSGSGQLDSWHAVATGLDFDSKRMELADVTGDGALDLLIAGHENGNGRWALLPGAGGGQFGPAQMFGTGQENTTISAADVSGDGMADVVVTSSHSKAVGVHTSQSYKFSMPPAHEVGQFTRYHDVADIDLDGDVDVVTAYSTRIHSLLNAGDGTFTSVLTNAPLQCMEDVLLRDIDGDLYPDLLMVHDRNCSPYHFYTARNLGNGTWGPLTAWFLGSAGGNHLATMDWDNDGDVDVLVTETLGCPSCQHRNYLLDNNGDGTFAPFRELRDPSQAGPKRAVGADVNHDGLADIVGSTGAGIQVFLGNGDGTFQLPSRVSATTYGPDWLEVVDMNDDGHLDVVYVSGGESFYGLGAITGVLLGNGTGDFVETDWEWGPFSLTLLTHFGITTLDADGDGNRDVLVSGVYSGALLLFRGEGDGTIRPQERFGVDGLAQQARVADFDGDGVQDVSVVVQNYPPVGSSGVSILRGSAGACYANCDGSTTSPALNVADFSCFLAKFAAGDDYANCDGSTSPPVLNVADFSCFLSKFAAGCP